MREHVDSLVLTDLAVVFLVMLTCFLLLFLLLFLLDQ